MSDPWAQFRTAPVAPAAPDAAQPGPPQPTAPGADIISTALRAAA